MRGRLSKSPVPGCPILPLAALALRRQGWTWASVAGQINAALPPGAALICAGQAQTLAERAELAELAAIERRGG